jgi:predicted enzyme related to lactoylglutathione lyase
VIADPQGASFAIYQTGEPSDGGGDAAAGPGRMSWNELATTDHEAGFEFYRELFGWTVHQDMDMGEHGIYRIYGPADGPPLGGMFTKPAEMPGPPAWLFYATVADLDAAVQRASELGGRVLQEPIEVPGGDRIAHFLDPQGAFFALHETASG